MKTSLKPIFPAGEGEDEIAGGGDDGLVYGGYGEGGESRYMEKMRGRSLTDYTITSVLIWYLTYDGDDLVISAVFASIQSSSSSLFVIFMAHAADSYVGRFSTLLFSNTAYIGGLTLLWLFNPWDTRWLIVISVVLLSLGTSGDYILEDVLLDLVNDVDKSQNRTKARSRARAKIWSRVAYMFGAISATLWVAVDATGGFYEPSWSSSLLICIITMTATLVIFCMGHNIYHQGELTKRPVEVFLRVFHDRVHKCNPRQHRLISVCAQDYINTFVTRCFTNFSRQDRLPQNLQTGKTGNEDMVVVKSLLKMFPMWGLFFVVSIISATGFTFFLKQYSNLNVSNKIPIQVFGMDQDLSRFVIPLLYNRIRCLPKNEKFKIGVGMLCGILSCIFAWKVEVYRLKEVDRLVDKDSTTSMSFLWLVPQFCALGCMEGLTIEGLLKFYRSQIKEKSLQSYGEEYIEIVMGLGKAQDLANDDQEQDNQVFPDNHDQAQAN
ncbi:hypothetical protein L1987_21704 [Smallanthus sonchifolius]|uniref:Uncharacterized protein n=1 Tax=Smallanthus sonchifolius TaxID=185202 RepID=A0ACB9IE55_9ASTR|nr:hypothetical protein L1987_21704 [Smallanthus sonchifolius]